MIYKADSRGNMDLEKITRDVLDGWKEGKTNITILVDMTDYVNASIQKAIREKGIKS